MKFACPQCSQACGLLTGVCPHCGLSLSLNSVLKFYWRRLRDGLTRATRLRCPQCGFPNPVQARGCAQCQSDLTVRLAVESVVAPPRRRWHRWLRGLDATTKRRIRWGYLLGSAALLWWLLGYVAGHGGTPVWGFLLSVVYVAALAFGALWLIPRRVFRGVFRETPRLVRLAVALNLLTLMLGLQLLINAWWARALILGGLLFLAWWGLHLLHRFILPVTNQTAAVFLDDDSSYDSASPQGRNARFD
jgi:hypothetical protein